MENKDRILLESLYESIYIKENEKALEEVNHDDTEEKEENEKEETSSCNHEEDDENKEETKEESYKIVKEALTEKSIKTIESWVSQNGSREAAYKLISAVVRKTVGLSLEDLADTPTVANGLDEIEGMLDNHEYNDAYTHAKEVTREVLEDEGYNPFGESTKIPHGVQSINESHVVKAKVVRKAETDEFVVKVYIDGKYNEEASYYTDDKADAFATRYSILRNYKDHGYTIEESKKVNPWAVEKSIEKKTGKKFGKKHKEEIIKGIKKSAKKAGKKITSDKVK